MFTVSLRLSVILGEFGLFSVTKELGVFFQTRHCVFMVVYRLFLLVSVGSVMVTPLFLPMVGVGHWFTYYGFWD